MVDDSRGPGPEECSVCFTEYGGAGDGGGGGGGCGGGGGGGGGGSGGGGGGSATQERGVVVARVTASGRGAGTGSGSKRPQPGSEGQLYRVQFQGGATEVLRRRALLGMVDDSRGPGPEECSVCFTEYGGMGGGESEGEGEGEGDDESEGADEDGAAGEEAAKQPAMLTCGHVFCAGCVGTMHSNEQASGGACSNTRSGGARIICPQCRASSTPPPAARTGSGRGSTSPSASAVSCS
jgi:hypothetical protein